MNFTVLDQYISFVENNFIKKDPFQIDVLERIYGKKWQIPDTIWNTKQKKWNSRI